MSKKPRHKRKQARPRWPRIFHQFQPGSLIRVKPGIPDPNYPDIPLGGWTGTILVADPRSRPPTYLIEWDEYTLANMHPVFRKRCERDDVTVDEMWLEEADLEPATRERVPIEQPSQIVTRPLNPREHEDRIRAIFGLTSDDPLPEVDEEILQDYRRYLAEHLTFPFGGQYAVESGPDEITEYETVVVGLSDEVSEDEGICCEMHHEGEPSLLPLAELQVKEDHPNRQLIADYGDWFWTGQGVDPVNRILPASPRSDLAGPGANLRTILSTLVYCALYCGLYGGLLGALVGAVAQAWIGAVAGAAVLGLISCWIGALYGRSFAAVNDLEGGPLLGGSIFAVMGSLLGAWLGAGAVVVLTAYEGTLLGTLLGVALVWLLRMTTTRVGGWLWGGFTGACLGTLGQAIYLSPASALVGALYGVPAGAVGFLILFLAAVGTFVWLRTGRMSS